MPAQPATTRDSTEPPVRDPCQVHPSPCTRCDGCNERSPSPVSHQKLSGPAAPSIAAHRAQRRYISTTAPATVQNHKHSFGDVACSEEKPESDTSHASRFTMSKTSHRESEESCREYAKWSPGSPNRRGVRRSQALPDRGNGITGGTLRSLEPVDPVEPGKGPTTAP